MGKNVHRNRENHTEDLTQIPKNLQSDGIDVEFSTELADQDDLEAQARAEAADRRAHNRT